MPTEMTYSNIEVYKRSLEQVVRKEPEWAASRIIECERLESYVIPAMQSELDLLRARIGGFQHVDDLRQAMVDTADENNTLRSEIEVLRKDAERYRWIESHVSEQLTEQSLQHEYSEHKTQYVLPKLIAWANFCGQITFAEAIDAAMAREKDERGSTTGV